MVLLAATSLATDYTRLDFVRSDPGSAVLGTNPEVCMFVAMNRTGLGVLYTFNCISELVPALQLELCALGGGEMLLASFQARGIRNGVGRYTMALRLKSGAWYSHSKIISYRKQCIDRMTRSIAGLPSAAQSKAPSKCL